MLTQMSEAAGEHIAIYEYIVSPKIKQLEATVLLDIMTSIARIRFQHIWHRMPSTQAQKDMLQNTVSDAL